MNTNWIPFDYRNIPEDIEKINYEFLLTNELTLTEALESYNYIIGNSIHICFGYDGQTYFSLTNKKYKYCYYRLPIIDDIPDEVINIFKWLLGYTEFPEGLTNIRKKLRQDLENAGIYIENYLKE